jgi:hypothetical protein
MTKFQPFTFILTTDEHPEKAFFENPKLLGLGRQIGLKNVGAFWVFSAKLQYPSCPCESLVHGFQYVVVVFTKKTLDPPNNSQL